MRDPDAQAHRSHPRPHHLPYATRPGSRFPPGASVQADGVNFCVFRRHAKRVELLQYEADVNVQPLQIVALDREENRTFFFWHVFVVGLAAGCRYTWRVSGAPGVPQMSDAAVSRKELLDPYARAQHRRARIVLIVVMEGSPCAHSRDASKRAVSDGSSH